MEHLASEAICNPNPNSKKHADWVLPEALHEIAQSGSAGLIFELLEAFEADTEPSLRRMRDAIAAADISGLNNAAHGLKGSSQQMAADGMASICQELELAPVDTPTVELMGLLTALEAESTKVCRAMSMWRYKTVGQSV